MYNEKNYKNKTYADIAAKIYSKYKNREDSISKDSMNLEFENLAARNDQARSVNSVAKFGDGGYPPVFPMIPQANWTPNTTIGVPQIGAPDKIRGMTDPFTSSMSMGPLPDIDKILSKEATMADMASANFVNPVSTTMQAPELQIPTQIKSTDRLAKPTNSNTLNGKLVTNDKAFTTGDLMQMASGALQSMYYQNVGNQPIAEPRFNRGYDLAKQQISQMQFNTQAEQNQRIRNRNAYTRGVEQNSPNNAIRLANLQGIFAQDDLNTQAISAKQQQFKNQIRQQLGQLEISKGQDRLRALQYQDQARATRDQFKHTGMNLAFDNFNELGNLKNYYDTQNKNMEILKSFPMNFDFGTNILQAILGFSK